MIRRILFAVLVLTPHFATAGALDTYNAYQVTLPGQSNAYDSTVWAKTVVITCPDPSGAFIARPCNFGSGSGGGGSGGTVTQGVGGSASSPWYEQITAGTAAIGSVTVSNLPATQPVSGSVSVSNFPATQPVSATSLPLPTGAATSANQAAPTVPGTSSTTQAMPVQGVTGGVPLSVQQNSGVPSACTTSTVGTSATLVLDSVANGAGRAGGGLVLPVSATAPVEYQWSSSGTGLTTTPGGLVFQAMPGSSVAFGGAPNSQLYAISTAAQAVSCMTVK